MTSDRAPENAGPLNAHNLGPMREPSPDCLCRFLSHTESLLWLDQAHGQLKQPAGKARPARSARPKQCVAVNPLHWDNLRRCRAVPSLSVVSEQWISPKVS
jgi:hypothetical protein